MAVPLAIHWLRLDRVARYLINHPAEVWHYDYQDNPGVLDEICGADWMSYETTSCIIEKFGQHILDGTVNKQKETALSSREADLYPIVRAGAQAIQSKKTLKAFGHGDVHIKIHSESRAARVIGPRHGPGKPTHLDITERWIDDIIRATKAEVEQISADRNCADIGIKGLERNRLKEILAMMPITRKEGLVWVTRASTTLAFLAGLDLADAGLPNGLVVQTQPELMLKTTAPNTLTLRYLIALAVYVVVIHVLAAGTILQWWRRHTGPTPLLRLGDDSDSSGSEGDAAGRPTKTERDAQAAENLLLEFRAEELRELCKARGLPICGRKSVLAARFLSSHSRATNRQLASIGRLVKRNHRLTVTPGDLDSVGNASAWMQNQPDARCSQSRA